MAAHPYQPPTPSNADNHVSDQGPPSPVSTPPLPISPSAVVIRHGVVAIRSQVSVGPALVRALYESGKTLAQVGAALGVSDETIRRTMVRHGIPRRPPGSRAQACAREGRTVDKSGYVLLLVPDHPHANHGGYVREHRLVMEEALGRYLSPEEVVHHINGIKHDNRLENLRLFASNSEHKQFDMAGNQWAKGDLDNPKRSYRVCRSPQEILHAIRDLAQSLNRPIRRRDLCPPAPSYRAATRAWGSWQRAVELALNLSGLDLE